VTPEEEVEKQRAWKSRLDAEVDGAPAPPPPHDAYADDEPAIEVSGAHVFAQVCEFIPRYVRVTDVQIVVLALWVMMTHALEIFDCIPYLSIVSPEKQSGKTRLLETLALIVARPWLTGGVNRAVLVRKVHSEQPTLLLDEFDAFLKGDKEVAEAVRGVLNTGYLRSGRYDMCIPTGRKIEFGSFSTFCPKAIASIRALSDTVAQRSIPIDMERKLRSDKVAPFRRRQVEPKGRRLHAELAAWGRAFTPQAHPDPIELELRSDRAADICEPLLVIAESCGPDVLDRAKAALVALCGHGREEDLSQTERLLADIRTVFEEAGVDRMTTAELAARLAAMEDAPWGPRFGRPFDAKALNRMLKPHGLKAGSVRFDDEDGTKTGTGYYKVRFEPVWARYVPL
jgi:Protein of unknown function (DUF3631)